MLRPVDAGPHARAARLRAHRARAPLPRRRVNPDAPPRCHGAGIGKEIARKLAAQGLNVVLVALGDRLLDEAHAELQTAFPDVEFRKARAHTRHA